MGLLSTLFGRREEKNATINLANWRFLLWPTVHSGVEVNEQTALEVQIVMAIVRRISQDIAKLDKRIVRRLPDQSVEFLWNHPLRTLLKRKPNKWQTGFEFFEMMTAHAVLYGNAVALKQRVGSRLDALVPLLPRQYQVRQLQGWRLEYDLYGPQGEVIGTVGPEAVFHLRNLSWNGYAGLNISRTAREAIGLAAALERNQASAMKNGAKPQGILTTSEPLTEDQVDRLAEGWKDSTTGPHAYGTPILDSGVTFQPISMNSVDQQLIETRKHQVIEICAGMGMLPAVLGVDDKTQAFASVEAMMQAYVDQVIWPWVERWQSRLDRDCLDDVGELEVLFDVSQMRKASAKDQAEADAKLVTNGLRLANELRARDGLPGIPGGDIPMRPMNMTAGGEEPDE